MEMFYSQELPASFSSFSKFIEKVSAEFVIANKIGIYFVMKTQISVGKYVKKKKKHFLFGSAKLLCILFIYLAYFFFLYRKKNP